MRYCLCKILVAGSFAYSSKFILNERITMPVSLHDLPGYPEDGPKDMLALVDADHDQLSDIPKLLRAAALDLLHSNQRQAIYSPWDAHSLLSAGHVLHTWTGHWKAYLLDDRRLPVLAGVDGRTRYVSKTSSLVFDAAEFQNTKPGYTWLLVYGGPPDILQNPKVVTRLKKCARTLRICDILFWDAPVLFSARAGVGMSSKTEPVVPGPAGLTEIFKES